MSKLVGIEPKKYEKPSSLEIWRESLDSEDREWFDSAVRDSRWSVQQLLEVVKREAGAPFGKDALHQHRKAVLR